MNNNEVVAGGKPNSTLIVSVIIVLALLAGGIYYAYKLKAQKEMAEETQMIQNDEVALNLGMQSQSDELKDIGSDLDSTDLDSMDY